MTQNTQTMMRPALIGGASLGVASAIPPVNFINCACCALVIGGGVLASYLYFKDAEPTTEKPYGEGITLGALAGIVGALVSTVISIPVSLLGFGIGSMGMFSEALENADLPPEVADMLATIGSGGFAIGALLIGLVFSLVINVIFAGIGGAIGVAIFVKKPAATA